MSERLRKVRTAAANALGELVAGANAEQRCPAALRRVRFPSRNGAPSSTYKDQHLVELAHRANKNTLNVRPIFLHNDDRIAALISIVGLALLIYGLIETDLRQALGPDQHLPGLLPEGRAARPTGRNILTAFQALGATHTPHGIRLDRLTTTQRAILNHLNIDPPWPEQGQK